MPKRSTAKASGLVVVVVDVTWRRGITWDDPDEEVVATDTASASSSGWVIRMAEVGNMPWVGVFDDCWGPEVVGDGVVVGGVGCGGSGRSLTTAFPSSYKSCAAGGLHG